MTANNKKQMFDNILLLNSKNNSEYETSRIMYKMSNCVYFSLPTIDEIKKEMSKSSSQEPDKDKKIKI